VNLHREEGIRQDTCREKDVSIIQYEIIFRVNLLISPLFFVLVAWKTLRVWKTVSVRFGIVWVDWRLCAVWVTHSSISEDPGLLGSYKSTGQQLSTFWRMVKSLSRNFCRLVRYPKIWTLTLYLLTWRIWWAPNNASKGQVGYNSAFKGLKYMELYFLRLFSMGVNLGHPYWGRNVGWRCLRIRCLGRYLGLRETG
jgi:hypothetical protein